MAPPVKFVPDGHRACLSCATSKSKCTPAEDGTGKCERCYRLQKECIVRPKAQRRPRHAEPSTRQSRTAVLEERIDEIVALLSKKSRGSEKASMETSPTTTSTTGSSHINTPHTDVRFEPRSGPDLNIDDVQAEERLAGYRHHQAEFCPFMEIPLATSAAVLRQENPVLFCAIMMTTSYHDWETQKVISQEALTYVANEVMVQGRKSLGLLQGVLVLLNWYQPNLISNPQLTNLCHLAMALSTDLGLYQAVGSALPQQFARSAAKAIHGPTVTTERWTLEERRALLGCFYLTSVISTCFSMLIAMPWSPNLQEACSELEARTDSPNDLRLSSLVRLQRLTAQISQVQRDMKQSDRSRTPISLFIRPFEEELKGLFSTLPEHLCEDCESLLEAGTGPSQTPTCILLQYHVAEIHLYSFAVMDSTQTSAFGAGPDLIAQHTVQHNCLVAVSNFGRVILSIPPGEFYSLPMTVFTQFGFVIIAMARLKLCNPALVAESQLPCVTISEMIDRFAENLEATNASYEARGVRIRENMLFRKWASWLKTFKVFDQALVPGIMSASGASGDQVEGAGQEVTGADLPMDWGPMFDDLSAFALFGMPDDALLNSGGMGWGTAAP